MRQPLFVFVLVLSFFGSTARAGSETQILHTLILKKEAEVAARLAEINAHSERMTELRSHIERARASNGRTQVVAFPAVLLGSAIAIASFYKLKTSWHKLGALPRTFYGVTGAAGTATTAGASFYLFVQSSKLRDLELTIDEAETVLAITRERLAAEREELTELKATAGIR